MREENIILQHGMRKIDVAALIKVQEFLTQILSTKKSELDKNKLIQVFKFTSEVLLKIIKEILKTKNIELKSNKEFFEFAEKEGLIENSTIWLNFIKKINGKKHNQKGIDELIDNLPRLKTELYDLIDKIKNYEKYK
ncbi:nucleotidyltransferase substrate binding protein [Candidatus Babeliales bacterium]|nr:nucleotidyltransferase substrate binding protein [Candidatus Babeliales bacterium]MCF7899715.1 nucleotidyltransferase substrate binding protein [Candidatus Babeliales bacterium]